MPYFSVIVPIFNVQDYIGAALDSLRQQTWEDFEVIVIDDGSTDQSGNIVERFCGEDERFKYHRTENRGPSAARNFGIDRAQGRFIYFMDGDDAIRPEALDICAQTCEKDQCDVVLFDAEILNSEDAALPQENNYQYVRPVMESPASSVDFVIESLKQHRYFVSPCCYVCTRQAIGDLRFIDGIMYEDNHFFLSLLLEQRVKVSIVNRPLFLRRVRAGSIMTSKKTLRHYNSMYRLLHEVGELNFAAAGERGVRDIKPEILSHLLGDLHSLSAQLQNGVNFDIRQRNLAATLYAARHADTPIAGMKRWLLAAAPELYRLKGDASSKPPGKRH